MFTIYTICYPAAVIDKISDPSILYSFVSLWYYSTFFAKIQSRKDSF